MFQRLGRWQFMNEIGGDECANTRACCKKEGKGLETREILLGATEVQVSVKNKIRGTGLIVTQKVHDEESQVVENIDGGNFFAELYGIK